MAELYTKWLVGWRAWKIKPDADILSSVFMLNDWSVDVTVAEHLTAPFAFYGVGGNRKPDPHHAPLAGHQCGLNAYADLDVAVDNQSMRSVADYSIVFGAIAAWGRIVLHEVGFRAEKARVLCLVEEDDPKLLLDQSAENALSAEQWLDRARKVADRYGVPLLPLPLAVDYAAQEGAVFSEYCQEAAG